MLKCTKCIENNCEMIKIPIQQLKKINLYLEKIIPKQNLLGLYSVI